MSKNTLSTDKLLNILLQTVKTLDHSYNIDCGVIELNANDLSSVLYARASPFALA